MGEGSIEGQNLKVVQANWLNEDEIENGLLCSCGDVHHPSMAVVTYPGEEVKGREPLDVHPLAVVEELGVPYSVSLDWVVERVKNLCHVVGLSCEGFEDQLLALFIAIEASRHQTVRLVFQIYVLSQLTKATVN